MNGLPLKLHFVLLFNSVKCEENVGRLAARRNLLHHLRVDLKKRFTLIETYVDIFHLRELASGF